MLTQPRMQIVPSTLIIISLTSWSYYFPVDVGLSNNFGPTVADLGLLGFLCVGWLMIDSGLLSVSGFARAYVASHVYL